MQAGTTGSVAETELTNDQEVALSVLRTGPQDGPVPAGSVFFLSVGYTKGLTTPANIPITGGCKHATKIIKQVILRLTVTVTVQSLSAVITGLAGSQACLAINPAVPLQTDALLLPPCRAFQVL